MPERVQLSRAKGWRMPPNTEVVARPTKWGNPFKVADYGHNAVCVKLFELWLDDPEQLTLRNAIKRDLRGKNLACWCKQSDFCHADVLLEVANK